jgi:hypothetical protein
MTWLLATSVLHHVAFYVGCPKIITTWWRVIWERKRTQDGSPYLSVPSLWSCIPSLSVHWKGLRSSLYSRRGDCGLSARKWGSLVVSSEAVYHNAELCFMPAICRSLWKSLVKSASIWVSSHWVVTILYVAHTSPLLDMFWNYFLPERMAWLFIFLTVTFIYFLFRG